MIIGLTGTNGSGKTVACGILERKGFQKHSLSDVIREELAASDRPANRKNLIAEGNRLRADYGPAELANRICRKLHPDQHYVIDSIRSPHEVRRLREWGQFRLLRIDAPREVRYERVRARGGHRMPVSLGEFAELEDRELESADPHRQQLRATWGEADATLHNGGTLEDFEDSVVKVVKEWMVTAGRPGWDQYFMQIARIVAMRSNCMKRKVAAVIVKDRRIISTGYNGTPRGARNCNEGGCPRCNAMADSGTRLGDCLCSHAEENAIVQAAYHGISVKGATLYSTFSPCLICTKMIINAGIEKVVYSVEYPLSESAKDLMAECGVDLAILAP